MRVVLLHFGQFVDFEVSITFLRSAVFAIFAIGKTPFGAVRLEIALAGHGKPGQTFVSPAFCPETTQEAFGYQNPYREIRAVPSQSAERAARNITTG
jgi:hypothetical protein